MPLLAHTFRVFVSSTFADLTPERNALHERVYPKLRDLCMSHGCRFQAIDLRWGIGAEAGMDQRTVDICLDELRRCQQTTPRPNFLVLLGDRYGWRPLPSRIEAREFEAILAEVPSEKRSLLLADVDGWYRRDDNAVPAEFVLRGRTLDVPPEAPPAEQAAARGREAAEWSATEAELRSLFRAAIDRLGWPPDDPRRVKYETSATHQEVIHGALAVPDARDHVVVCLRRIRGLEALVAADPPPPDLAPFVDLTADGRHDTDAHARQRRLQGALTAELPENVRTYDATWAGDAVGTEYLERLSADVLDRLSALIEREIARLERINELDRELAEQNRFREEHARVFVGQARVMERLRRYLYSPDQLPLALVGPSGCGKTSIMARLWRDVRETFPAAAVALRFIGATPTSTDGRALLEGLCREVARAYGVEHDPAPMEFQRLVDLLPERLALATAARPLVVLLDALDQLGDTDNARGLAWLPAQLPDHVRVIVSTTPGECLDHLRRNLPPEGLLDVDLLPPADARELLAAWSADARRELRKAQTELILSKFERSPLPLYLKLAFEEARRWKSYTAVDDHSLRDGVAGLVESLFDRLGTAAGYRPVFVHRALGCLVAARHGLTEDELLDLLSRDAEVFNDFVRHARHEPPEQRVPVALWARLHSDLQGYLVYRAADGTTLLTFYHRQVAAIVRERYLSMGDGPLTHRAMADYFRGQSVWFGSGPRQPNPRRASELPWHVIHAGPPRDLADTLTSLEFIEAKCVAAKVAELLEDYRLAGPGAPEAVTLFSHFVAMHAHVFRRDPSQVVPFAHNYADGGPVVAQAERWRQQHSWQAQPWVALRDRPPLIRHPALLATLEGHRGAVSALAMTGDATRAVSGSADGTLRLWDLASGVTVRTFRPPGAARVNAVALSPDGRLAVSAGADGWLHVWDLQAGTLRQSVKAHGQQATAVEISHDGHWLASGGRDGAVRLWTFPGVGDAGTFTGHFGPVSDVAVSRDGRRVAAGGWDGNVWLWDARTGRPIRCLRGTPVRVLGLGADADLSLLVTAGGAPAGPGGKAPLQGRISSTVRFWSAAGYYLAETWEHELVARGGIAAGIVASAIFDVAVTPDGKRAASVGYDGNLIVWDATTGAMLRKLRAHPQSVLRVAVSDIGDRALTASEDRTIRLWDLAGDIDAADFSRENRTTLRELNASTRRIPFGWGKRPPHRRVGTIGRDAPTPVRDRLSLLWKNQRVRRYLVEPFWCLATAAAIALVRGMPDPGVWPAARSILALVGYALMIVWYFEWTMSLRNDLHEWRRSVFPGWLVAAATFPFLPFSRVVMCPNCGNRICGRRGVLYCFHCGWRD